MRSRAVSPPVSRVSAEDDEERRRAGSIRDFLAAVLPVEGTHHAGDEHPLTVNSTAVGAPQAPACQWESDGGELAPLQPCQRSGHMWASTERAPPSTTFCSCPQCPLREWDLRLSSYLCEEGPTLGSTIITAEIPYMSIWEVTESWRWEGRRYSHSGVSKVDRLINLCQARLAECSEDQINELLELAESYPNFSRLRETLLERASFSSHDFGIVDEKDLEQIHMLRVCGSSNGALFHPEKVEEWSGPQNIPASEQSNRWRRSSVVTMSTEVMRTGRVVTLEMATREYETALKRNWRRLIRVIEDRTDLRFVLFQFLFTVSHASGS